MTRTHAAITLLLAVAGSACGSDTRMAPTSAAEAPAPVFRTPGSRERFEIQKAIVLEKLDTALLPAMRAHGVDMWIVLDRENHSDPMHAELGGGYSGVRGAFIYFDNGGPKPERIFYGSHEQPANSVITQVYDEKSYYGYSKEGLSPLLKAAVEKRNPKKIAVNTSFTVPDLDGLTVGLKDFLTQTIGPTFARRIVSAESVAREFRTTRTPLEQKLYTQLLEWSSTWQAAFAWAAISLSVRRTMKSDTSFSDDTVRAAYFGPRIFINLR